MSFFALQFRGFMMLKRIASWSSTRAGMQEFSMSHREAVAPLAIGQRRKCHESSCVSMSATPIKSASHQ
jgi:hypothetical protein